MTTDDEDSGRRAVALAATLLFTAASAAFADAPALVSAAREQTLFRVVYDGSYTPMGTLAASQPV